MMDGIGERHDEQRDGDKVIALVAEPVGQPTACRRHKIMPQWVVALCPIDRARQEQRHQPGEDRDRHPIISGFQRVTVPCLSRGKPLHKLIGAALVGSTLMLAACQQAAPSGQVIATVDGVEITLAELNGEASARNLAIATDPAQRAAAIADLVKRKLLVRAARAQGLDRTPQFVLAERRMREILLAQQVVVARLAILPVAYQVQPPANVLLAEQQRAEQAVADILASQRDAKVTYQRGFAPDVPIK